MKNKIQFALQLTYCIGILVGMTWFAGCRSVPPSDRDYRAIVEHGRVLVESNATPEAKIAALQALREQAQWGVTRDWIDSEIEKLEREIANRGNPWAKPPEVKEPVKDPTFFSEMVWLRKDTWGPDAQITKRLHGARIDGGHLKFAPLQIADWPSGSLGGDLKGVMCAAIFRDGKWRGGKFEHIRHNMHSRHLDNIRNGYIPDFSPRRGEPVRYWILSYDGKQASNVVEVKWP